MQLDNLKNSVALLFLKIFVSAESCADYVKEAATTAARIHSLQPAGGVLIFLTGMEEVLLCIELIKQHTDGRKSGG